MLTINRTLSDKASETDRMYLNDHDLGLLEKYAKDFANRSKTYNLLRDRADVLVQRALKLMGQEYPSIVAQLGDRCTYDMSKVLQYIALSILRDDTQFFRDYMSDWLSTILGSYQVTPECSTGYRKLQEVINAQLPPECANLVKPYTDLTIAALNRDA
jgi:hypothetical protein